MRVFAFWLLLGFAGCLWSTEIAISYEVIFPIVKEDKPFNQSRLIEQAFQKFLIQSYGSDKVLNLPPVIQALAESDQYVTQFSFHENEKVGRYIKVNFNKSRINQLFHSIKQPLWEQARPLTLIWLVIERNQTPVWVGGDSETEILQAMEKVLQERAIPFVFPLLDLTDTEQVREQHVINEELEPLIQSAKRYHVDEILLGRLSKNANGWLGHWTLVKGSEKISWDNTATALDPLLQTAAEELSSKLMRGHFEVTALTARPNGNTKTKIRLMISGVFNATQYTTVLQYLHHLPEVSEVEMLEVTPGQITFELEILGNTADLIKSIAAGHVLIEQVTPTEAGGGSLSYKVMEAQ